MNASVFLRKSSNVGSHLVSFAQRLGRAHEHPGEVIVAIEEIVWSCHGDIGARARDMTRRRSPGR